ncbi:hypothetical protein [Kibdelosporangium persicum]
MPSASGIGALAGRHVQDAMRTDLVTLTGAVSAAYQRQHAPVSAGAATVGW